MKKRVWSVLLTLVMIISMLPVSALAIEPSTAFTGTGTEADPYLLSTAADLEKLSEDVAAGNTYAGNYFKFTADITLPDNWTTIGSVKDGQTWSTTLAKAGYNPFSGVIDGDNYTLTVPEGSKTMLGAVSGGKLCNLNIYGTKIDGYGVVEYYYVDRSNPIKAEIENVTLKSGTHTKYSGFIGGYASGSDPIIIRNCTVEQGVVIGDDGTYADWAEDVSAVFNYPWGPTGLQFNDMIGSFGGCFNGTIENCVSHAKVYGRNYVGGIMGFKGQSMGDCIVRNCTFDGEVHASGKVAGGIMGGGYAATSAPNTPAATVENCTCSGSVSGATYVGGIFGGEEHLKQCWNNGVGYIRSNYFNGTVTATADDGVKGGIIGYMNSLDRYNIIYNNYYLMGTAENGIGGVNTANIDPTNTHYGRTDDPTGSGADKLTTAVTEAPAVRSTRAAGMKSTALNKNPEPVVYQNTGISSLLNSAITVYYFDGTTESIKLSDCAVTGLDLSKTGYQMCTASYQGYTMYFGVNVKAGGSAPAESDDIMVTVSVLGDTIHEVTADNCHTLADGNLIPWISDATVVVAKDASVLDAIEKACSAYGISVNAVDSYYGGKYISSVTSAVGETVSESSNTQSDGNSYCGWQYMVNGESPWDTVDTKKVANGDVICLYFEDDYSLAYVQSAIAAIDKIDGTSPINADDLKAAQDSVMWLSPIAKAKVTNYDVLTNALANTDPANNNSDNNNSNKNEENTPTTPVVDGGNQDKTPATGDTGVMLWVSIASVAMLCATVVVVNKKRHEA